MLDDATRARLEQAVVTVNPDWTLTVVPIEALKAFLAAHRALEAEQVQAAPVLAAAETLDLAIHAGMQGEDGVVGVYLLTGIVDRLHEAIAAWRAAREGMDGG